MHAACSSSRCHTPVKQRACGTARHGTARHDTARLSVIKLIRSRSHICYWLHWRSFHSREVITNIYEIKSELCKQQHRTLIPTAHNCCTLVFIQRVRDIKLWLIFINTTQKQFSPGVGHHKILEIMYKMSCSPYNRTRRRTGGDYSSVLSLTTALDRGGWSTPRPGRALPPGNTRYPFYWRLGGPQGRSGRVQKISSLTGIRSPDRPARCKSLYQLSGPLCSCHLLATLRPTAPAQDSWETLQCFDCGSLLCWSETVCVALSRLVRRRKILRIRYKIF